MFTSVLLEDQFIWNTPLLVGLFGIGILYLLLLLRLTDQRIYEKQPLFFFLSLGLLSLTLGSPLTTLSHLSFSLHMIQMSVLYFVIPPLFLFGIPSHLFQSIRGTPIVKKSSRWFFTPRIALIAFAGLFLLYHLPAILNIIVQTPLIHNGYIFVLFILSLSMWYPIVSPDPRQRLSIEQKKQYAFLSGILLMPACLLLIVGAFLDGTNNPFLTQIAAHLCIPPQSAYSLTILPPPFNTKFDQVTAGFIMLGIHKIALAATARLEGEVDRRVKKSS